MTTELKYEDYKLGKKPEQEKEKNEREKNRKGGKKKRTATSLRISHSTRPDSQLAKKKQQQQQARGEDRIQFPILFFSK